MHSVRKVACLARWPLTLLGAPGLTAAAADQPQPCHGPAPCRTWQMAGKVNMDVNCVAASGPTAYDTYLGDETAAQQNSQASYLTAATSRERKYGWELAGCSTALPYICEVAPDAYSCSSPPSPPPEPPSPPPPPMPPAPPTCESFRWLRLAVWLVTCVPYQTEALLPACLLCLLIAAEWLLRACCCTTCRRSPRHAHLLLRQHLHHLLHAAHQHHLPGKGQGPLQGAGRPAGDMDRAVQAGGGREVGVCSSLRLRLVSGLTGRPDAVMQSLPAVRR